MGELQGHRGGLRRRGHPEVRLQNAPNLRDRPPIPAPGCRLVIARCIVVLRIAVVAARLHIFVTVSRRCHPRDELAWCQWWPSPQPDCQRFGASSWAPTYNWPWQNFKQCDVQPWPGPPPPVNRKCEVDYFQRACRPTGLFVRYRCRCLPLRLCLCLHLRRSWLRDSFQ